MRTWEPPAAHLRGPLLGKLAASTHRIGGKGASLPTAEVREPLLTLKPSLRSGGTPQGMMGLSPGSARLT